MSLGPRSASPPLHSPQMASPMPHGHTPPWGGPAAARGVRQQPSISEGMIVAMQYLVHPATPAPQRERILTR